MKTKCIKAFITGLDRDLADELMRALSGSACEQAGALSEAHIAFCPWDPEILRRLRTKRRNLPVVVVSPLPDTQGWLDALEAGAADYCAAPFETVQIRWILESSLRHGPHHMAAA